MHTSWLTSIRVLAAFLMLAALCALAMLAARHLNQPVAPPERIA